MKLADLFQRGPVLSFELFPPKSDQAIDELLRTVKDLDQHQPDFLTCTYGAGGSTREKTLAVIAGVHQSVERPVASHLTCVGATKDQLREYLQTASDQGVEAIVALRGDPPKGESSFQVTEGGLRYANELVSLIKDEFPQFGILVAGYPEVHQEAPSAEADLQNLVRKVDAGADAVVTQLFYDNEDFFRFVDACQAAGITVPIVPGILPVLSLKQVKRITALCKAKLPAQFLSRLEENDSADWQFKVGVEHATAQTQQLIDRGVPGLHLYVLNKSTATNQILGNISGWQR